MVEVRSTGILQLSCRLRESRQPSKFSVTGDPALDARAMATQPEEPDDLDTTPSHRRALAPQPSILHPYPNLMRFLLKLLLSVYSPKRGGPLKSLPILDARSG
jgi:hypothetical protein